MRSAARKVSGKIQQSAVDASAKALAICLLGLLLLASACNQIQSPKPEPFVGAVAPPRKQEFRWSNGKLPKSFDPALAASSPETDVIRALYEGLTDVNSANLEPIPAIAAKWSSSEDYKTWTFYLRQDAKWSNGEAVTARDFVKSWKRLTELGEKVGQRDLFRNIVGMDTKNILPVFADEEVDRLSKINETSGFFNAGEQAESNTNTANPNRTQKPAANTKTVENSKLEKQTPQIPAKDDQQNLGKFGVEAVDNYTLKVSLNQPDREFPALVAHPIFRPVYGDGKDFDSLNTKTVTSGAFTIVEIGKDGLVLERSQNYWNKNEVKLDRVRFVPTENAESALAAYRAGEIDAITNANLEPLALKLLTPYDDFRRTKYSALNFYEFNLKQKPFSDRRVREALAIAIERERLTQGEMDGATEPALNFSPFESDGKLDQDAEKAKKLLNEAGFPEGKDFPKVRLVVNRNNVQLRIARSVAAMWKKNLRIETEIIVKDQQDFENAVQVGDFDIIRRGIVLPTTDETTNMLNMFPANRQLVQPSSENIAAAKNQILNDETAESKLDFSETENVSQEKENTNTAQIFENPVILTEEEALQHLPAIPLYFPTSYSLVKPYVQGFEMNELDAISLKNVQINSNWQPTSSKNLSNGKS